MKLLDTPVVVDIDRGRVEDRVDRLDEESRHAISAVTLTELRLGVNIQHELTTEAHSQAAEALDRLQARFDVLEITQTIALDAADVIADLQSRGEPHDDLHDVYIGATARTERLSVLTANVDHFRRIDGVDVLDWSNY